MKMGNCEKSRNIENMEEEFFIYPKSMQKKLNEFRRPCELKDLAKRSSSQASQEFDILERAKVPSHLFDQRYPRYYMEFLHSQVKVPELGPDFHAVASQLTSLADGRKIAIISSAPRQKCQRTWQTLYYKDVKFMLMLCQLIDSHIGIQADKYWPDQGKEFTVGKGENKIRIRTNKIVDLKEGKGEEMREKMSDETYNEKQIVMEGPLGTRILRHVHWDGWRDLGTPKPYQTQILQEVLDLCLSNIESQNMIWIHCFSGVGRSGTFSSLLEIKRLAKIGKPFSIFEVVENIRKYRNCAVQMDSQYRYLYKFAAMLHSQ